MLALWGLIGLIGGACAHRLAGRALESEAPGVGWLPRCARCGRPESPHARIAVIALLLRRRCPGCDLPPSREQALVEIVTAALVVALRVLISNDLAAAVYALATIVLVTVTLTDLRERLIPNAITYPATIAALALSLLPGLIGPLSALAGALAGGGLALLIWLAGRLLYRRGDVFGLGDVKLSFFIGAVTGFPLALTALVAGIVVGGLLGIGALALGRSRSATIAYGPALAIGGYLALLLQP